MSEPKRPNSSEEKSEEILKIAREILTTLLSYFPLKDEVKVSGEKKSGRILLEIKSKESGLLIGKKGQTLLALEYVLNRLVQHQTGSRVRVYLDCDGYRRRRKQWLERIAREGAEEVVRTGTEVRLGPMEADERKIIHLALKDHPQVYTESQGFHPFREVVIKPKPESKAEE